MLNGIAVYQAFVTRPGQPGGGSGLRAGDMARAVSRRSEGAPVGYAISAVPVCLLGPGSVGDAPGCITTLAGLLSALHAPGAIALLAGWWLHLRRRST